MIVYRCSTENNSLFTSIQINRIPFNHFRILIEHFHLDILPICTCKTAKLQMAVFPSIFNCSNCSSFTFFCIFPETRKIYYAFFLAVKVAFFHSCSFVFTFFLLFGFHDNIDFLHIYIIKLDKIPIYCDAFFFCLNQVQVIFNLLLDII